MKRNVKKQEHGIPRLRIWKPVMLLILAGAVIIAGGVFYGSAQEQEIVREKERELRTIAEFKVSLIIAWLQERFSDVRVMSGSPFFSDTIAEWLADRSDTALRDVIVQNLDPIKTAYDYEDIILASREGRPLFSLNKETTELSAPALEKVIESVAGNKVIFSDFYYCPSRERICLDFIAPVSVGGTPQAVLIFRINPDRYLYPLVQSWPTPSASSETLLVKRDGDEVLFLNELRHRRDTALVLRIPLSETDVPAVQAALGHDGIYLGKEYRGVDVLAVILAVPGTPWHMVAKVDTEEIFYDLHFRIAVTVAAVVIMILLSGSGTVILTYSRRNRFYKRLYLAERELRASQDEFRTTLYSIGDAVITTDSAGRIRRMNGPAEALTGRNEDEAKGGSLESVFKIINEETRTSVENPVKRVLREGLVVGLADHTLLVSRNGRQTPIADSGAPIRNDKGEITGVVLVFRDQSDERAARRALEASERKFRETVVNLDEGYYSTTVDGILLEHNRAFNRILGFDPEKDLKGIKLPDFWPNPDDRRAYMEKLTDEGSVSAYEINARTAAEQNIVVFANAHLVRDEENRPLRIEGTFNDITERKRAEAEILRLNAELEQRVRDRTAQLDAANKELESFAYSVSHDLRAPLRAIDGFSGILLEDHAAALDGEGKRVCSVIRDNTQKMGQLIDDLLAFSRFSRVPLKKSVIDMKKTAETVFLELTTPEARLRIDFHIGELPFAAGDLMMIRQVWINLISNALKFSSRRAQAEISITSRAEADEILYYVQDNGAGFNMRYSDKLFGVFQRLHSAREFAGTGVGLAIVRRIIVRHGGRVRAEGEPDKGASFCFSLPREKTERKGESDEQL